MSSAQRVARFNAGSDIKATTLQPQQDCQEGKGCSRKGRSDTSWQCGMWGVERCIAVNAVMHGRMDAMVHAPVLTL